MRKTPKVSLTTKEYCLFFSIQQALSLKTCKQKNPYSLRSQISSSAAVSLLKKPEGDEKNVHEGKCEVYFQALLLPPSTLVHLCKGTGLVAYENAI